MNNLKLFKSTLFTGLRQSNAPKVLAPSLTELRSSPAAAPALAGPPVLRGERAELREEGLDRGREKGR